MTSVFKIISSEQWEEAQITGLIPPSSLDNNDQLHLALFDDLPAICSQFFKPEDYPIALEFSANSFIGEINWVANQKHSWKDGWLKNERIIADTVLNIYSFALTETNAGVTFSLLGES